MTTSIKKLLLVSITLLLGVMSSGVNATNYDFTITSGDYAGQTYNVEPIFMTYNSYPPAYSTDYMPWWGNSALAQALATQANSNPDTQFIVFAYAAPGGSVSVWGTQYGSVANMSVGLPDMWHYATGTLSVGAPEIDGSLAPKVGFLLGCLFLMFGRKKQNSEPMLVSSAI